MKLKYFLLTSLMAAVVSAWATPAVDSDEYNYGVMYYHGWMTDNDIKEILLAERYDFEYGHIDTLELSHILTPANPIRHFFQPVVSDVEVAGNITRRADPNGTIYEFNPYLIFRWQKFPWDRYVKNTFAIGEGLSYATDQPYREVQDSSNRDARHLLNFLMLEATVAAPAHPEWEGVLRLHHRCGAWSLFGAGMVSSNTVSLGVRYLFN